MRPRDVATNPSAYGRSNDITWVQNVDKATCVAATIQHEYVLQLRNVLKSRRQSVKAWCEATDQNYQRVSRYMTGSSNVTVFDMAQAVITLGLSVTFVSDYTPYDRPLTSTQLAANTEARDAMGAFYTPRPVAEFMVSHVIDNPARSRVLEPSFGDGSFLTALSRYGVKEITGADLDGAAAALALNHGLLDPSHLWRGDFFDMPISKGDFTSVVGNPPFVRIRTLDNDSRKSIAKACAKTGVPIPEEASTWMAFVLRSTLALDNHGSLAFVLPHDATYVRYARPMWDYLAKSFGELAVVRVHDRIFPDLMQDVVLLYAKDRGNTCSQVALSCYENLTSMAADEPCIKASVPINEILSGKRGFLEAMVPVKARSILSSHIVDTASSFTSFHIGYVCGDKSFFHPTDDTVKRYGLPETSLIPTAATSRDMNRLPVDNTSEVANCRLWRPSGELVGGETQYIAYGKTLKVDQRYKCRVRKPWYVVPGVVRPDILVSVFGDAPRLVVNTAGWTYSNSVLGGSLTEGVNALDFALAWYTPITLLSAEIEVHALGGGVMVAVPREANKIRVLKPGLDNNLKRLDSISRHLRENNVDAAYHSGDIIVDDLFGKGAADQLWDAINLLRSWRRR